MPSDKKLVEALLVNTLISGLPTEIHFADSEQSGWLSLYACPAKHWHAGYAEYATGAVRDELNATGDTPQAALMGLQILVTQYSE